MIDSPQCHRITLADRCIKIVDHFITKPENPAELEQRLRSLLKNMEELSGIRRGSGSLEATAGSAVNPGSVALRQFLVWGALFAAIAFLVAFAYSVGVI